MSICTNCIHKIVCDHESKYRTSCSQFLTEKPQWIPCSERLPQKYSPCIVTDENGAVFEYDYNDLTVHDKKWTYCRREIVAWMPLPKPYEAGDPDA